MKKKSGCGGEGTGTEISVRKPTQPCPRARAPAHLRGHLDQNLVLQPLPGDSVVPAETAPTGAAASPVLSLAPGDRPSWAPPLPRDQAHSLLSGPDDLLAGFVGLSHPPSPPSLPRGLLPFPQTQVPWAPHPLSTSCGAWAAPRCDPTQAGPCLSCSRGAWCGECL